MKVPLTCTRCDQVIEVFQIPFEFVDTEKFVCVPCLDDRYWDLYPTSILAASRIPDPEPKKVSFDPRTMEIPF